VDGIIDAASGYEGVLGAAKDWVGSEDRAYAGVDDASE